MIDRARLISALDTLSTLGEKDFSKFFMNNHIEHGAVDIKALYVEGFGLLTFPINPDDLVRLANIVNKSNKQKAYCQIDASELTPIRKASRATTQKKLLHEVTFEILQTMLNIKFGFLSCDVEAKLDKLIICSDGELVKVPYNLLNEPGKFGMLMLQIPLEVDKPPGKAVIYEGAVETAVRSFASSNSFSAAAVAGRRSVEKKISFSIQSHPEGTTAVIVFNLIWNDYVTFGQSNVIPPRCFPQFLVLANEIKEALKPWRQMTEPDSVSQGENFLCIPTFGLKKPELAIGNLTEADILVAKGLVSITFLDVHCAHVNAKQEPFERQSIRKNSEISEAGASSRMLFQFKEGIFTPNSIEDDIFHEEIDPSKHFLYDLATYGCMDSSGNLSLPVIVIRLRERLVTKNSSIREQPCEILLESLEGRLNEFSDSKVNQHFFLRNSFLSELKLVIEWLTVRSEFEPCGSVLADCLESFFSRLLSVCVRLKSEGFAENILLLLKESNLKFPFTICTCRSLSYSRLNPVDAFTSYILFINGWKKYTDATKQLMKKLSAEGLGLVSAIGLNFLQNNCLTEARETLGFIMETARESSPVYFKRLFHDSMVTLAIGLGDEDEHDRQQGLKRMPNLNLSDEDTDQQPLDLLASLMRHLEPSSHRWPRSKEVSSMCDTTASLVISKPEHVIKIEDTYPLEDATPLKLTPMTGESQENHGMEKALLTHFVSPGEFYVQNKAEQLLHEKLLRELANVFNSNPIQGNNVENVDKLYAFKKDNGGRHQWERCKILQTDNNTEVKLKIQLIDVGDVLTVSKQELFSVEPNLSRTLPIAKHCRLWGLQPAGHISHWSKASIERSLEMSESAAAYIKTYYTEVGEDGSTIHYVRLFFEKVQLGGALECDQYITCLNNDLLERGLALRQAMAVSVQPSNGWPSRREIPLEFVGTPITFEDGGIVYLHALGAHDHTEAITGLLDWHYAKMDSEIEDLRSWKKNEPCIIRYPKDNHVYRATVIDPNDDAKEAMVFLIDYADLVAVPYKNMRRMLICFEYAPQAWRCKLAKYSGSTVSFGPDNLAALKRDLLHKNCYVSVVSRGEEPTVYIKLQDAAGKVDNVLWWEPKIILPVSPSATPSPSEPSPSSAARSPLPAEPIAKRPCRPESIWTNGKAKFKSPLHETSREKFLQRRGDAKEMSYKKSVQKPIQEFQPPSQAEPSKWYSVVPSRDIISPSLEDNVKVKKQMEKKPTPKSTSSLERTSTIGESSSGSEKSAAPFSSSNSSPVDEDTTSSDKPLCPQFVFGTTRRPPRGSVFPRYRIPYNILVPVRVRSLHGNFVMLQMDKPDGRMSDGCPSGWHDVVLEHEKLSCNLQRTVHMFPNFENVTKGLPCACLHPIDHKWYRAVVTFVSDDGSNVSVLLVDTARRYYDIPTRNIKQMPDSYIKEVPQMTITCRLACKKDDWNPCVNYKLMNKKASAFFEYKSISPGAEPKFCVTLYY